MLRNPLLIAAARPPVFQIFYPDNIYAITSRNIEYLSDELVNVTITFGVFPDEAKSFQFDHPAIRYDLLDYPNDEAQLNPAGYEDALLDKYGEAWLDGTQLKDFIQIP